MESGSFNNHQKPFLATVSALTILNEQSEHCPQQVRFYPSLNTRHHALPKEHAIQRKGCLEHGVSNSVLIPDSRASTAMFSELIAVTFLLSLALGRFDANLFVVLPMPSLRNPKR